MSIIKFNTSDVLPALTMVNSVILAKNSLPILNDVLIKTKKDKSGNLIAEFTSSDTETWLNVKANIQSCDEERVDVCVDAKTLLQALRNLPEMEITMEIDEDKHSIACKYANGSFQIPTDNTKEFPVPQNKLQEHLTKNIDAKKLLCAIEKSGFATANDELRPVMNGIHFDFFADGMVSVASDGRKLAKYKDLTVTHNGADTTTHGFTLNKKSCNTLMNVLSNTFAGDVQVFFNNQHVLIFNEQFGLMTRLMEGRYPNYDLVIPKDNDKIATVRKTELIAALKRVVPMGNQTSELVSFQIENNQITISAEDIDFSTSAKETIKCEYSAEPLIIGFKGSVLLQMLQNVDGDNIKMLMKEPNRACIITEENSNKVYEYTSLVMPMLVN